MYFKYKLIFTIPIELFYNNIIPFKVKVAPQDDCDVEYVEYLPYKPTIPLRMNQ
jgi:hypothetical protein